MDGIVKVGAVLAGYVVAALVASAAVAVRLANTSGPDAQASAGMYAFGDLLVFVAVFGIVALLPTGMALFFLRPYRLFWIVLSIAALVLVATGVSATVLCVLASYWKVPCSPLELCAAFAVLRMLASPLLATSFMLSVFIAPDRTSRWALLAATGIEGAVAMYSVFLWFVGPCFI